MKLRYGMSQTILPMVTKYGKVHIFREGHKIAKNPIGFIYLVLFWDFLLDLFTSLSELT